MELTLMNKSNKRFLVAAFVILCSVGILYKGAQYLWGEHYLTFFKGIVRNPLQVGAFSPCTRFVAKEITKYVGSVPADQPVRILEVGAGSGVFTTQLESMLAGRSGDYIVDVIEIDPHYCQLLQERFKDNPHFVIHCTDVSTFQASSKYDYIVSSVPFNTMDNDVIKRILDSYTKLITPEGVISYVEHLWLPELKGYFMRGADKQIYAERRALINGFKDAHVFETVTVYANITPLYVYHLRIAQ